MKIAMWSGPRNLSTAMMYAFGARTDCAVIDEPFYAAYLAMTGLNHPMREEVLAAQPQDPKVVAAALSGPNPGARPFWYQKHMTQHMIPGIPRDWMRAVRNVFLIRHPARVIASYAEKRENPTLEDIGFQLQAELFDEVSGWGGDPVVIDSHDIRENPARMLEQLCDRIGVPWSPHMLSWPRGGHKDDGIWAQHWYGAVWNSTGFAGPEGDLPEVPEALQPVLQAAMPFYERMRAKKI
ncbi:HAD family hydrolase [Ruegeria pomeroyi]|uniref:HAD family hydrolase n=1 Tax=Ruegeria pomeroyi TaxID=89184 RepID=A0A9Q3WMT4_9RHOB|nr:HAD family hydrolase [Ruegeria pomeroyi]MCE8518589.1 HAD family hydrolase [Ruegeria pomeroyi]MCE8538991.1 HAD family hydrolase [Ruegeria pomeroyi]